MKMLCLIFLNLGAGLALEHVGAVHHWAWAEPLVDVCTFALYFYFLWRPPVIGHRAVPRSTMVSCLAIATMGELLMSACLHFYLYRASLLPLFVPPGHVLLFLAGLGIVELPWLRFRTVMVVVATILTAFVLEILQGHDWLSAGFLFFFLPALLWGPEKSLYAVMFCLALGLEFYGTALGTWAWQPKLFCSGLVLDSANPPLASGGAYAILDLLTLQATLLLTRSRRNSPAPALRT